MYNVQILLQKRHNPTCVRSLSQQSLTNNLLITNVPLLTLAQQRIHHVIHNTTASGNILFDHPAEEQTINDGNVNYANNNYED